MGQNADLNPTTSRLYKWLQPIDTKLVSITSNWLVLWHILGESWFYLILPQLGYNPKWPWIAPPLSVPGFFGSGVNPQMTKRSQIANFAGNMMNHVFCFPELSDKWIYNINYWIILLHKIRYKDIQFYCISQITPLVCYHTIPYPILIPLVSNYFPLNHH